ncbi:glycosyltransferase [Ancylobacter oerskovii]|uniref:Glycosyltransferase n=1 Tax=Ancylobacter oerskovii TaxID=459519 RepID=A0ABW4Z6D9_9HYPH|nr:glycosyltransferase [Ancylobacter oerskovii]MBS7543033.1 hypothetical protein [Ancylobacter oerskovii]
MSVTFVGLTRFSVVTQDSLRWFASTRELSVEDAKRVIFNRDRLRRRLELFRRYALPTYIELTKRPCSYGVVVINSDLPSFYKSRLYELTKPYQNIKVISVRRGQSFKSAVRTVSIELADGGRLFSYRLDDDDALPPSFVATVSTHSSQLPDGTAISPINGWTVSPAPDDVIQLQKCRLPYLALGLGVLSSSAEYLSAFQLGNHMTIHKRFPVHCISSERPLWLRTKHETNDSVKRRPGSPLQSMTTPEACLKLRRDFPFINCASLRVLRYSMLA